MVSTDFHIKQLKNRLCLIIKLTYCSIAFRFVVEFFHLQMKWQLAGIIQILSNINLIALVWIIGADGARTLEK